ncbi:methyltransferase domain-containing protein [Falsiroseomonas oryzae]|uniref:methyltransferase domain-containing protein n=1 Tax=Falsiroseomonas oryzae TaxID=2766473 RepID=UPI0022EAF614|nr:methyltransferase domain-containing protein [Roseomonas sp. MO-31]
MAGQHWIRVVMERRLEELGRQLPLKRMTAAEISGRAWKRRGFRSYETLAYPSFDICRDRGEKRYDCIIAEQVWEHLIDPVAATANVFAMLNPGGTFIISTPFLIKLHAGPLDCSRWSPTGMRSMLVRAGFEDKGMIVESWGNRACLIANLDKWAIYDPEKHDLKNEPDVPLVVWAIARKPAEAAAEAPAQAPAKQVATAAG